jgi:hypothetical protein
VTAGDVHTAPKGNTAMLDRHNPANAIAQMGDAMSIVAVRLKRYDAADARPEEQARLAVIGP